ncbi:MAG TPA: hypothetical protein DD379_20110 [Cyanobacteria bacterium UBA11162]|nr:hypothetical protein [Cyanobacteria bacterium UBA11162]
MTTYQQALDDFAIIQLLQKLILVSPVHLESEERESLAASLIEQLSASLNGHFITEYIKAVNCGDEDLISDRIATELQGMLVRVTPKDFIANKSSACFQIGDRIKWKALSNCSSDWGIVIGRFYTYARHRLQWGWKYIIWLDENSPSSAWTVADTAWEEDLYLI